MRGILITLLLLAGIASLFLHGICDQAPTGRMVQMMSRLPLWNPLGMESAGTPRRLGGPVVIHRYSR